MVWRNWSGLATADPQQVLSPASADDWRSVQATLLAGTPVKPVGAGHSFTGIAVAPRVQLDLSAWTGLVRCDQQLKRVTLRSGTRLWQLPAILEPLGLTLANIGNIDRQSIAGASSTGTHGTGVLLGSLADQVVGARLLLGTGQEQEFTLADDPDTFQAVRLGLGALGIITELTLQCVDAYDIHAVETTEPRQQVWDEWIHRVRTADQFEFLWFPHAEQVNTKTHTRLPRGQQPRRMPRRLRGFVDDEVLGNGALWTICRVGATAPWAIPALNRFAAAAINAREVVVPSRQAFVSPRRVRFAEMEYGVPLEEVPAVLDEMRQVIRGGDHRSSFPIEVRAAAAEDAWLATSHGRETGHIAVHQWIGQDRRHYFDAVEAIFAEHGGRPHWGKLHTLDHSGLSSLYPRMRDFVAVRDRHDPLRLFSNPYLDKILGR